MIQAFGGRWLSADGKRADLNRPETRQAITYMADLINRYQVAPAPSAASAAFPGGNPLTGFLAGMAAMIVGVTTNTNDVLAATQVQVGTSLLPRVRPNLPRGITRVDGWSVTAGSRYPREAWEVCKFIAGPEGSLARADAPGQAGALGCTMTAWSDPRTLARLGPMQPMLARALDESEVNILAANYRNDEWQQVLNQKLAPVWTGEVQVTGALVEDLQQSIQAVLDKPKLA
jgi:multiple sugar transport system substrate-binding protein